MVTYFNLGHKVSDISTDWVDSQGGKKLNHFQNGWVIKAKT